MKMRIYVTARVRDFERDTIDEEPHWYVQQGNIYYELSYFEPEEDCEDVQVFVHDFDVPTVTAEQVIPKQVMALEKKKQQADLRAAEQKADYDNRIGKLMALPAIPHASVNVEGLEGDPAL